MPLGEITELAVKLLQHSKRYAQTLPSGFCQFDYVNLKEDVEEHQPLLELIRKVANDSRLNYRFPRLTKYRAGDFCNKHVDTIPHAVRTCVIRLNYGTPLLRYNLGSIQYEPTETPGVPISFSSALPHEVLPVPPNEERIVLNFWLVSQP